MNSFLTIIRHTRHCLAAALLLLLPAACSMMHEDYAASEQGDNVQLTLSIYTNQTYAVTREATGDVSARTDQAESTIYDIQVWAFTHNGGDGETAISYAEAEDITAQSLDLTMLIGREYIAARNKLDFYILANPKSIGLTGPGKLPAGSTRAALKAASFGNSHFGTATLTRSVPPTGLPITQVYKGNDSNGVDLSKLLTSPTTHDNRVTIELRRAISKLRFIFSRKTGITGVQITKIEIFDYDDETEGLIPNSQLVFPNEDDLSNDNLPNLGASPTYTTGKIAYSGTGADPLLSTADICQTEDPELLRSDCTANGNATKTAQQYQEFIDGKIADNEATEFGLTYLRESDKKLKGKIYYKYRASGEEKSKEFFMDAENSAANFVRNHTWSVYAYFKGSDLYVKPFVQPWNLGGRYTYTTDASARLTTGQQYLRWDTDGDLDTWQGSYVAVTHEWDDLSQVPGRTPLIILHTTCSEVMYLQLDNRYFEFVVEESTGGVTTYREIGANNRLEIAPGVNVQTNFFVRPIKAFNTAEQPLPSREAHMSLVNNSGNFPAKVPLRSSMPGFAEGVDEVWFYWVSPTDYQEYANGAGPGGASTEFVNP